MATRLSLTFDENHPATRGHFPGHPIVPGAVLLDMIIRAAASAFGFSIAAVRVPVVKFLHPVASGCTLSLNLETAGATELHFAVLDRDRQVAIGQIRFESAALASSQT